MIERTYAARFMCGSPEPSAAPRPRTPRWPSAATAMLMVCITVQAAGAQARGEAGHQDVTPVVDDEVGRREAAALVGLVDAAMNGRSASDFPIAWRNDFFKAQTGTFVPFTVSVDRAPFTGSGAWMYVRAVRRGVPAPGGGRSVAERYPFDLIFPVELGAAGPVRITRGFAVPPGDYDIYVALRERMANPEGAGGRPRASVLRQPLSVPDFWSGALATSTVMLADRIEAVGPPGAPEDLLERPYRIGENEIHLAPDASFRRDRELIVVFLIYNPTVSANRDFDVQVDYHLFRSGAQEPAAAATVSEHPPARAGEQYVTRTTPQRFRPAGMGAQFDPGAGQPMLAGQGILLSSFQEGEYRLGITVTDLLSRQTLSRDVTFRVAGS